MDASSRPSRGWDSAVKVMLFVVIVWFAVEVMAISVLGTRSDAPLQVVPQARPQVPQK